MTALRALLRGWRVFVPVIILDAAAQSLLVWSNPTPKFSWQFSGLVLLSLLALLAAAWLTTAAASAAVDDVGGLALQRIRRRPVIVAWLVAIGIVAVAASLLEVWMAPIALILGAFVLPPAAAEEPVLRRAWSPIVRRPLGTVGLLVGVIVLALVTWIVALVLGFFVTGVLGAAITWLWFGLVGSYVLCLLCSLYRRSTNPQGENSRGANSHSAESHRADAHQADSSVVAEN
jgi:hypothetical protein